MKEQTLVKKCLEGNRKAQKQLFNEHAPQMMTVCKRYANSSDQATDMLQEGFIKVFQKLNTFSGTGSLAGWIRMVVINNALTMLRREKKFSYHEDVEELAYIASTDTDVLAQLSFENLMDLISSLPLGYKTVFNLYAVEGFAHKEIAEKLGITESTSKTQYRKAKLALQKLISENG